MARAKDRLKTEYIVWQRLRNRHGDIVDEGNAMGTGFRFDKKREARHMAAQFARRSASFAEDGFDLEVYIVPTPRGAMQRNEALWEQVEPS